MLLSLLSRRSLEADSRDSYGFTVRPQHLQRFREYANIYKEEEKERSEKWNNFLESQSGSLPPRSLEEKSINTLHTEESTKNTQFVNFSSGKTLLPEVENDPDSACEGDGSTDLKFGTEDSTECVSKREVQVAKSMSVMQTWVQIRPCVSAVENITTLRVKTTTAKDGEVQKIQNNLPSIEETKTLDASAEEYFQKESFDNETVNDSANSHSVDPRDGCGSFPQSFFSWKEELECLVRGGVPKALRGEVWQAFVGVGTRRVEMYYQELLSLESNNADRKEPNNSQGVSIKFRKQIDKDISRTFPGHPALNEDGRDSLRRVLLAYARHNPSVGYCQAMNFFAGLLLLMMPEENAFWTLVGIIDDYFDGYYSEEMIESQVDQLVFEDLMREKFPKLVNHLDYLGVQVAWICAPWFLSIFVNMLPWESVLRVWDVLLFEGNRVMLFRTALALMELYGPALITTKDAADAISLLQNLAGSTFDSSQLIFTACMSFLAINEAKLQEMREKHRPSILVIVEERTKGGRVWKDPKGLASKLYSFKHPPRQLVDENKNKEFSDTHHPGSLDEFLSSVAVESEADTVPDLQEQVIWLKVELCRLLEEKRSTILRAEELEAALIEMVRQDTRRKLSARVEQLEQEVDELRQALADKQEQEKVMLQVLMRVEQEQRLTEDARRSAEQNVSALRDALQVFQEKYEKAMVSVAEMEKRAVMAESMLEATLQYESGQTKALTSPGPLLQSSSQENKKTGLLAISFGLGWRDRNKDVKCDRGSQTT